MTITLSSAAFDANQSIPQRHTADGVNLSPPLSWSGLPEGAEQLALIVDDPDAPRDEPFVHWVIYGIPVEADRLPENVPSDQKLSAPVLALQGVNDFGNTGYGGPSPPKGHGVHHYHFKLYALDQDLNLAPGLTKQRLLEKIQGHVLAEGELVGVYER
jgi:Raf kinase inhibitor-like YbhB/YbcL family protein